MRDLPSYWAKLISREEAERLLGPYFERFEICVLEAFAAWTEFASQMPGIRAPLGSRTRASFINDHMAHRARGLFESEKGVKLFEQFGFLCLNFDSRVVVHFKKLDEDGIPSSYPTEQQKKIAAQELEFPGGITECCG